MTRTEPGPSSAGSTPAARPDIARIIRRRLKVFLAVLVLVPLVAYINSARQPDEYTANASLLFRESNFDQLLFDSTYFTRSVDADREAATNVRLVSLEAVTERVSDRFDGVSAERVDQSVSVTPEGQSDVVSVEASWSNPEFAAELATAFASEYIEFRREADRSQIAEARALLRRQIGALEEESRRRPLEDQLQRLEVLASLQTGNAELVQPAEPPASRSAPRPLQSAALGGVLGLLLAFAAALLADRVDLRLRDPDEVETLLGVPIIGSLPMSDTVHQARRPSQLRPGEAEAFRLIRTSLRHFAIDRRLRSLMVTSSTAGDGKSTLALNLAEAAASLGDRVLLVEGDVRSPSLAQRLGLNPRSGLTRMLSHDSSDLTSHVQSVPVTEQVRGADLGKQMDVLVSGPIPPNPGDIMSSAAMANLLAQAVADYDFVIVDTPPAVVVGDALSLAQHVDAVLTVARLRHTPRPALEHLRHQLELVGAPLLAAVVNGVPGSSVAYDYAYGSSPASAPAPASPALEPTGATSGGPDRASAPQ